MAVTQKPAPGSTFGDAVTVAAWRTVPSWYQVSGHDRMINPEAQRWMAQRIGARHTLELDAGHASLATRARDVAGLVDEATAELVLY
nr:alpha/beta hydrolase [Actinomycetospora sp. TBRC 11914]